MKKDDRVLVSPLCPVLGKEVRNFIDNSMETKNYEKSLKEYFDNQDYIGLYNCIKNK